MHAFPTRSALAHDWLNQAGGAEVVLQSLHDLMPAAPIYTSLVDPDAVPGMADWDIRPSWLTHAPLARRYPQALLPLYPLVWSRTRVPAGTQLVVSNKSAFCHGINAGSAVHVCYCLTPTRFVWQPAEYLAQERLPPGGRLAIRTLLPALRRWDFAAAQRVDRFVAISTVVADRIHQSYGRASTVVFPPVDVDAFARAADEATAAQDADPYHLVVARLVPYKQIDLAIAAFNELGRRLVIVGDGRDRARLERLAGPTVTFTGRLPDADVKRLLAGCVALVWPGIEDFGLVPVEAMAAGRPVIARRAGGVLDTVVEGTTGLFFDTASAPALAGAVRAADAITWQPGRIRAHAHRFDHATFAARLRGCVDLALSRGKRPATSTGVPPIEDSVRDVA
ncbi:MAG: glycosyltransferase [Ardenticatenales bacterium]|jgi:glycosyltransferase involved in cell wall biosynthesis|nr:glycosyltransferase [Ardenticatenales bacterium]